MKITTILLVIAALVVTADAQQRDRPATPVTPPATVGTASVSGTVITSPNSEETVRSAIVLLIPSAGGEGIATVTDGEGRFTITNVPQGGYSLVAQKAAYLTNAYGAKRPGRPGTTLVLVNDQAIENLQVVLPKGGVITGRVFHAGGGIQRGAQVVAVPLSQATAGGRLTTPAGRTSFSDDRGNYRIWGLSPDDYIVMAIPPTTFALASFERRSPSDIDALLRSLAGPQPGQTAGQMATPGSSPQLQGHAPAYHPGTPNPAYAATISLGVGEVKQGIDIPIDAYPLASISGTVRGIGGEVTQAVTLAVDTIGPALPTTSMVRVPDRRPDAEGRFTFATVPPGTYRITALGGGITPRDGGFETNTANQIHWASATVVVDGYDVEGVLLSLQQGLTFSGRVEALAPGPAPVSFKGTTVALTPRGTNAPPPRSIPVADDGTFTVTGLHPTVWELAITLPTPLASTWGVQSVTTGGRDVRDTPITFDNGNITDVVVAVSDRRAEVAGTLTTAVGTAATDYFIVLFPSDRTLWHPHSPRVRVVRPNADGSFSARDLPSGDYRIAALTDVEDEEWRRPSFLESLLDASLSLVVTPGVTTRQDLRIQ
jgi:hypothetical protein